MAVGGENIGRAYVKVIADGSGFGDGIRKDLDDLGDDFEKAGGKHGEEYEKSQRKSMRKGLKEWAKEYERDMDRSIARVKVRTEGTMKGGWYLPKIERKLIDDFGDDVGGLLARRMKERFVREGEGMFENYFSDLPNALADAERDVLKIREKSLSDQQRLEKAAEQERLSRSLNVIAAEKRKWDSIDRLEDMARREHASREADAERSTIESINRLTAAHERLRRGQANSNESYVQSIERTRDHIRELSEAIEKTPNFGGRDRDKFTSALKDMDRDLIRVSPRLRVFNGTLETLTPRIGRAFGKGARNDFLNFFGSMTESLARVAFAIPRFAENLVVMARNVGTLGSSAVSTGGLFAGLGARIAAMAPAVLAGAVALGVLVTVLGVVVSAVSLLIATVVALAGTIYASMITAVGALAGALLPVAAGVGVLVAAIASMSDAQKAAVKTAIKPFVSGMKEIGRAAADTLFGGKQFTNTISQMTKALTSSNMKDLVVDIAQAIGDIGNQWAASLNSKGFQDWLALMRKTLPDQLRNVGEAARNTFAGLGGLFAGLQPLVTSFTEWLVKITGQFAEWANSEAGRTAIVEFFERGAASAQAFGGFLKEAGGFLQDLLFAGQSTGDDLFSSMADNIKRFRDYLKENPEALQKWFDDAKKFAEALGDVVVKAGELADALDSPGMRSAATGILNLIEGVITLGEWVTNLVLLTQGKGPWFDAIIQGLENLNKKFLEAKVAAAEFFTDLGQGIGGALVDVFSGAAATILFLIGGILEGLGTLGSVIGKIPGVPDTFGESARNAGRDLKNLATDMLDTKGASDQLDGARANPRTSDGGTNEQTKGKINGAITALSKLNLATAKPKTTDQGTNDAVRGKVNALDKALAAIAGTTKTRVEGSIFPSNFLGALRNLGTALANVAGTRTASVRGNIPLTATGGVFSGAQTRVIGEAGREAVVPLDRDLSQVDPAVRMLSAIAQGKVGYASAAATGKSVTIAEGAITVVTTSEDPRAVAKETLNEITGSLI